MRDHQHPHVRSGTFLSNWFELCRVIEQAAERSETPDGERLYEVMRDACESGWREGYTDGLVDGESMRGFVAQFEESIADLTARGHDGDERPDSAAEQPISTSEETP